ncbi:MAG: hypothetical protein ACRDZY_05385 [Acidimicrobiales bacterium]
MVEIDVDRILFELRPHRDADRHLKSLRSKPGSSRYISLSRKVWVAEGLVRLSRRRYPGPVTAWALAGLTGLSATLIAVGGDPFAAGLLTAVSLVAIAVLSCRNLRHEMTVPLAAWRGPTTVRRWAEDLHRVDHDCPVVLSVIRR